MPESFSPPEHKDGPDYGSGYKKTGQANNRSHWNPPIPGISEPVSKEARLEQAIETPAPQELRGHVAVEAARHTTELAFENDRQEESESTAEQYIQVPVFEDGATMATASYPERQTEANADQPEQSTTVTSQASTMEQRPEAPVSYSSGELNDQAPYEQTHEAYNPAPEKMYTTVTPENRVPAYVPETPSHVNEKASHFGAESSDEPGAKEAAGVVGMNLPELLTIAKEITVGGVNLEQLYHHKQIDQEGLKRVLAEYYKGGNPEQILASELNKAELRQQTPEFLHSQPTGSRAAGSIDQDESLSPAESPGVHSMLPAYDHAQYPSSTPQHLLPEYDQETAAGRRRNTIVVAVVVAGIFVGVTIAAILLI